MDAAYQGAWLADADLAGLEPVRATGQAVQDNRNKRALYGAQRTMPSLRLPRYCFVTTGSIASFRRLITEILSPEFLQALVDQDFTHLAIQCGPDAAWAQAQIANLDQSLPLTITSCDFMTAEDIKNRMLQCRGLVGVHKAGVVIGHAGAGTIIEANEYRAMMIAVPNPTLMDNHQVELADEAARQGLCVFGTLGNLRAALREACALNEGLRRDNLQAYEDPTFPVPENERLNLLDWTLLTCYPDQMKKELRTLRG